MLVASQPLLQVAARQLAVSQEQVPQDYVRQLQLHPEAITSYADFSLRQREGHGYGVIYCHTCNGRIVLGEDRTSRAGDGGRKIGIGSLDAYMEHCHRPGHDAVRGLSAQNKSPADNTLVQPLTTLGTSGRPGDNFSSSGAFRLPLESLRTWSGAGARKRLSGVVAETPKPHVPSKRMKIEHPSEADTVTPPESPELGSPPRPRHPQPRYSVTSLPTNPVQSVGRVDVTASQSPVPLPSSLSIHPFFQPDRRNVMYIPPITPSTSMKVQDSQPSSPAASRVGRPSTVQHIKPEVHPAAPIITLPASGLKIDRGNLASSSSNDPDVDGFHGNGAVETGLDVWIQNAANAEVFEENATVQSCMQKLGLKEQSQKLAGMQIALLPHQLIGVAWMREQETSNKIKHFGGILADEMGLGKTVQMIATMTLNQPDNHECRATLIVCPVALVDQWRAEIETKTTGLYNPHVYHGSGRAKSYRELQKYDVVITTYNMLAKELPKTSMLKANQLPNEAVEVGEKLGPLLKARWYRVVLDEAQIIRNRKTRVSSAAARLQSIHRWCLTGTPIVNSLSDAFPLIRVLRIRPWYEWSHYNWQIVKNEQKNPSLCGKRLQNVLKTCLLRRTKNSMLDGRRLIELPHKEITDVKLQLSQDEREVYNMVEKRAQQVFNRFLREGTVLKNYSHVFTLLLRLRQCACHPALIQEDYNEAVLDALDEERRQEELNRAEQLVSRKFIADVTEGLRRAARERVRLERTSLDAEVEDDCLLCSDTLDEPVITPCQHTFCKACALRLFDTPSDEVAEMHADADERTCPQCDKPFRKECLFLRSAFEPGDDGLALDHEQARGIRIRGRRVIDDSDDDVATSRRRPSATRPRTYSQESYWTDGDSDSMDDFIVQSGEDENEKNARKANRKKKKSKARVYGARTHHRQTSPYEFGNGDSEHETQRNEGLQRCLPSTKMKHMMRLLKLWRKEHPNDKTIVVSQYVSALDIVAVYLRQQGFNFLRYQGSMTKEARETAVKKFMNVGGPTVLLMSLKAGGVGLNLTRANRVISLDLGWSPAVEAQAFDRVHRLGQTKEVSVQRLVVEDTIEERILMLHKRKQGLADQSLGEGSGKKMSKLSLGDLIELFNNHA